MKAKRIVRPETRMKFARNALRRLSRKIRLRADILYLKAYSGAAGELVEMASELDEIIDRRCNDGHADISKEDAK